MTVQLDLEKVLFQRRPDGHPIIVSGPCSAETEEQVMETAKKLDRLEVQVFRAGIWKPRTRPDTFEGMGSVALPWLQRVKKETGLLTATEVANRWHVEEALKYNVDILWIGARTTANPFAVQELADALRGHDGPVMIKNPINPDIELWIGAMERINKAGIKKILAVHRGFSYYGKSGFRNPPQWEIPIELKRRVPDIPVITDPSHICGSKELIFDIAQRAMDLNFDGLFIESHINPEKALSDKEQQITPEGLETILNKLVLRSMDITDHKLKDKLSQLRAQIDQYDEELLEIFSKRMKISETIGQYKKDNNITIFQPKRWTEIIEKRIENGEKKGLSIDFVTKIFKAVHQESINRQNRIMN
jgi:chorismate mutase